MDGISFGKSILEETNDRVNVILSHLANVLKHEGKGFQTSITNVEFCRVYKRRKAGKGAN